MSEILQEKEKLSSLAHTHILDVINASERESKERAVFVAETLTTWAHCTSASSSICVRLRR